MCAAKFQQAIREKSAFHLYGPAGRGKATLTAYLAQEYLNQGGRVLWLPVGHQPLAALLCRVARHFRDDPRAQAALKVRDPGEPQGSSAPRSSLARCLRERQPLLVLADVAEPATLATWLEEIVGALPILSFGEAPLDDAWSGKEQELGPLAESAARDVLLRATGRGEAEQDADLATIATALGGEPLALALCGAAIQAGDWSMTEAAEALMAGTAPPTERVLRALIPRLAPAAQGLLLWLAFGPRNPQTQADWQRSSGTTAEEWAELRDTLRERALIREWPPAERLTLVKPIRQFLSEMAEKAGTAAELQQRAIETWHQSIRAALQGGAETWPQLPELLAGDEWREFAREITVDTDWRELEPLWQAAAAELEARGYAYELQELRRRAELATPEQVTAPDGNHKEEESAEEAAKIPSPADEMAELSDSGGDALTDEESQEEEWFDLPIWEEAAPAPLPWDVAETTSETPEEAPPPAEGGRAVDLLPQPISEISAGEEGWEEETDSGPILDELPPFFTTQVAAHSEERSPTEQLARLHQNGAAELERGEIEAAIASLSAALDLAEDLTEGATCAEILYLLGCAQLEDGAIDSAVASLTESRERFEAAEDPRGMADALGALGNALGELGRWPEAAQAHHDAVAATREADDHFEEALQLNALAYAFRRSQQLGGAVRSYRQALYLAFESEDANAIAQTAADLAEVLMNSPRHLAIAQLLLETAVGAGAPDQEITTLQRGIRNALAKTEAAGIQQAPVRGDAYAYARQAYEAHNTRPRPA